MNDFGNWQQFLDNSLSALTSSALAFTKFKEQKDDYSRIQWLKKYDVLGKADWIEVYLTKAVAKGSLKSRETAIQLRNKGNEFYKKRKFDEALKFYNESVLHAPSVDDASELALAYANRSALFYETRQYKSSLVDIELALSSGGYPVQSCYKLCHRRALCHVAEGNTKAAEIAFEEAKSSINENLEPSQKDKQISEINQWIKKLSTNNLELSGYPAEISSMTSEESASIPVPIHGYNNSLTCASQAVDMKHSKEKGRHLVANQPIQAGSVLIVEKPYASVLLPDHSLTRCHHCLAGLCAVIGCRRCSVVRYCSIQCRNNSWDNYHYIECFYTDLLHSVGVAHLGLRIVLVAGLDFLLGFRNELRKEKNGSEADNLATIPPVYHTDYRSVYDLMPHSEDMQPEDLFQYSVTAQLLLKCLERGDFFAVDHIKSNDQDDKQIFIGSLLLRHICQLVCNAHAITDVEYSSGTSLVNHKGLQCSSGSSMVSPDCGAKPLDSLNNGATQIGNLNSDAELPLVSTTSQERIATAIYPTASLMNHSCDPTIISGFIGSTLVVRAVKDITSEEEIFNCYGPHCKRMSRAERQESLSEQYFFTCLCTACEKEQEQELLWTALKCTHCEGPVVNSKKSVSQSDVICVECGKASKMGKKQQQELSESQILFLDAIRFLDGNLIDDAIQRLTQCYGYRSKLLYKHNRDLSETEDALARCYASKGEFFKAEQYLTRSLLTVEKLYGSGSIEFAHELQKHAELCSRVGVQLRTKAAESVNKALPLFELHYGKDCNSVRELFQLKHFLNSLS